MPHTRAKFVHNTATSRHHLCHVISTPLHHSACPSHTLACALSLTLSHITLVLPLLAQEIKGAFDACFTRWFTADYISGTGTELQAACGPISALYDRCLKVRVIVG